MNPRKTARHERPLPGHRDGRVPRCPRRGAALLATAASNSVLPSQISTTSGDPRFEGMADEP
jgi:hypothetical protein